MKTESKRQSKSVRILDIIASRSEGMRFTDIQECLWSMTHRVCNDGDYRPFDRNVRGYWCTNLVGGPWYHPGLLNFYCVKGPDGLYRRNSRDHKGRPWLTMKLESGHKAYRTRTPYVPTGELVEWRPLQFSK